MQNKGIIKLFAILFGLVSIYQLSFTFKANQIEDAAKEAAVAQFDETVDGYQDMRNLAEVRYIDSLKTSKIKVGEEF
jgi:SecD/SecF fusion protein